MSTATATAPVIESLRVATVKIRGATTLLFGSRVDINQFPKKNKESHDDYEKRTWRERCHALVEDRVVAGEPTIPAGTLFIPAFGLKRMLEATAQGESERIAGKGMATWTKKFRTGIQVESDMFLDTDVTKDTVYGKWAFVPSNGKTGGGTRVDRCFPEVFTWSGEFRVLLLDESIQQDVVERYAHKAGIVNGIGTWRPQNGGNHGRFKVESITWDEYEF